MQFKKVMRRHISLVMTVCFLSAFICQPAMAGPILSENQNRDTILSNGVNNASDRFIIKYQDYVGEEAKVQHHQQWKDKLSQVKEITRGKGQNYELIILNQKIKASDLMDALKGKTADIAYIQPDYQLSLSSNDPYFDNQWGIQNTLPALVPDNQKALREKLRRLPPHLREIIESHPELRELILNTPPEELRDKLMAGEVANDVPPHMLIELAHDPMLWEIQDQTPDQSAYVCDANVARAWEKSLGQGVTVALIDTGIDTSQEDLKENIWINNGEIPGDGIDNDNNGYLDDVTGWNFADHNNIIFNGLSVGEEVYGSEEKHGTPIWPASFPL